jgi:hypothetical protein
LEGVNINAFKCTYESGGDPLLSGRACALLVLALIVWIGTVYHLGFGVKPSSANTPHVEERVDWQGEIGFTMMVQKAAFEVGESVYITFTVMSIPNHRVTLVQSARDFDFTVYDRSINTMYVLGFG